MRNTRKENLTIFLILSVLDAAVFYGAFRIPAGGSLGYGADFMPKVVAFLLLACALGFLVQGLRCPKEETTSDGKKKDRTPIIRFIAAFGLLVAYAALLKPVGFIPMTIVYVFLQSQLMVPPEKRSYLISGVLAVSTAVIVFFVFTKGLNMILPGGILSGLF